MKNLFKRIVRNLNRPLPDLYGYLEAKILSFIWKRYLKEVGPGFHVCRGTRLEGGSCISIGRRFHGGPMLWIEAVKKYIDFEYQPQITIGNDVNCSEFVHIAATQSVTIEDGVLIGSRVHITDHAHGRYSGGVQDGPEMSPTLRCLSSGKPVRICTNAWLGDAVVVLPGVTIGAGSIIGANSVVSRDIPAGVIAVGAPALPIKYYDHDRKQWLPIDKNKRSD